MIKHIHKQVDEKQYYHLYLLSLPLASLSHLKSIYFSNHTHSHFNSLTYTQTYTHTVACFMFKALAQATSLWVSSQLHKDQGHCLLSECNSVHNNPQ
jgi:hypothetical protein